MLQSERRVKRRHRDRGYYTRPRSTQDLIPVDTVYEDGMFLSNGGIYSKSYQFSDINYTIADQSQQESLIRDLRSINKSCTASEISQITIVNRRINEDLLDSLRYQLTGDKYDIFREELNAQLESQIGRGTGIMQERYFTMSIAKNTPKEAKAHFDRVGTEMALRFAGMGSNFIPIGLSDRLRVLHDFYRPGDEAYWQFDLKEKKQKGHSFKDSIAPMSFVPGRDHVQIGDRYVRVLAMTEYASWVDDSTLSRLTNLDTEIILSVSFIPIPTDEAVKFYQGKLDSVEANSMRYQQKQLERTKIVVPEPYNIKKERQVITDSLNDITVRDCGLVVATITIAHMAPTLEKLNSDTELIRTVARDVNCEFNVCTEQQLDALNTVLPYGPDRISIDRTLTTESLAAFMPFNAQELCDPTGVLYGQNAITRNLVVVDRLAKSSGNGFVLGMTGGGKSFFCKEELVELRFIVNDKNKFT